jgi:hypothetical protein
MSDSAAARIEREVASWPGVSVEPHRFGGKEFRGWVSRRIDGDADVAAVVALFRLNYERAWK